MKIGYYELNLEGISAITGIFKSSLKTKIFGIPKIKGRNLKEIARNILRDNAKEILIAGQGHFPYMWVVDFSKAFIGTTKVLPKAYLQKQTQRIIDESFKKKYVPTCFTKDHTFDMPFRRQDNFPWLINTVYEFTKIYKDEGFFKKNKSKLEDLYANYMKDYFDFEKFLLRREARFDWMDSILRPSSTYSNLCLLNMFKLCNKMKMRGNTFEKETENALMKRWTGNHFLDYEGAEKYLSADANVAVLYFNLFSKEVRKEIYETIEKSNLVKPFPIKLREGEYKEHRPFLTHFAPIYHSTVWTHMGFMYLNGLKKNGFEYRHHLKKMEKVLWNRRNIIETFDEKGNIYSAAFISTEHGFTMTSGQYLELAN